MLHQRNQTSATRVAETLSRPISRARCRRGRRSSCSTSALLDTDHHGSSTQHTWGFPGGERSDHASLKTHKHTVSHSSNHRKENSGGFLPLLFTSNLCMVQCTHVHIHCDSTSHYWGSHCRWSKIQHRVLSPISCEDTLLAWLMEQR